MMDRVEQREVEADPQLLFLQGDHPGSQRLAPAIRAAGGKQVEYVEHPGAGHNVWTRTYADTQNLVWLFAQKKPE